MTTSPSRPTSVWSQMSLNRLIWVGVFLVLSVTAAFGGLASAERVTSVSLGQSYDDGPLRITVHSAALHDSLPGFEGLDETCRLLTLDATIESVADRSVALPTAMPVVGIEADCTGSQIAKTQDVISVHGVSSDFKGAVRLRDGRQTPALEPGFSNEYRLVWAVPAAELADRPTITARMPQMSEFISTFRIAQEWGGDPDEFGSLTLTPGLYS